MKKMIIVMPSLYNGGAERSLINLLNELPLDKYEIDLLLLKKIGMFIDQIPDGVNLLNTPKDIKHLYSSLFKSGLVLPIRAFGNIVSKLFTQNSRERRGFRWKYFYGPLIKPIEKHYDIALAYISGEILYLVDEKISADKKIVWIHNDYRSAQHPKKYDYKHLKNMDAIVSISDACVNILKEEFPEFSSKIYMLENITSSVVVRNRSQEFYPNEFIKNQFNIVSIGRLHHQKGFDIAIDAAAEMKRENLDFHWFIIGTGELHEQLKKQIDTNGLQKYVKLLGARSNPYPYIKYCDLFVQPSRYEGKSVVLDEAKILGAPIIATAYPTVYDQLKDGKEGIIVPLSVEGLTDGIKDLMEHEQKRSILHENLIATDYGNQDEIKKYLTLLEN